MIRYYKMERTAVLPVEIHVPIDWNMHSSTWQCKSVSQQLLTVARFRIVYYSVGTHGLRVMHPSIYSIINGRYFNSFLKINLSP